jgi:hypothetical protein
MATAMGFEVEQGAMIGFHLAVVVCRQLIAGTVSLTEGSTLGGCAVWQLTEIPAALRADGSPRPDLIAFALADPDDLPLFIRGQIVLLEEA